MASAKLTKQNYDGTVDSVRVAYYDSDIHFVPACYYGGDCE